MSLLFLFGVEEPGSEPRRNIPWDVVGCSVLRLRDI